MRLKNWLCALCHRSGDETELPEAIVAHRDELLRTAQSNANNTRIHGPSFIGPTSVCAGKIVMRELDKKPSPWQVPGVLGGDDPWI